MATLICPKCSAQYQFDESKLDHFARFRCKQCQQISSILDNVVSAEPEAPLGNAVSPPESTQTEEQSQRAENARSVDSQASEAPSFPLSTEEKSVIGDDFALAEKMLERLEEEDDIETIFHEEGILIEVLGNKTAVDEHE